MIVKELIKPRNIVVIGGSNNVGKPGGKVLKNIIDGGFKGEMYVVNPKETEVQGLKCFQHVDMLPEVDLAIISIPAKFIVAAVRILAEQKKTKGFIIISAGFSEVGEEGKKIEDEVVSIIDNAGGSLIGPNCIGVLNNEYNGVFAGPIPRLDPQGIDFVSGSGATACFILELGIPDGLTFSSLYSVGNSAHIGVEDIVKWWDETFDPDTSSRTKLLYMEKIDKPQILLKHARSLIKKGCRIAAVKSGTSEAGSRAASSHTGALASPDSAVSALFKKAGIVRCFSREELVTVAGIFSYPVLRGKNIAIITHAGGPGVMMTDALCEGGLDVPHIENDASKELLTKLFDGSSVSNPIDFLATGTAEQLSTIIDYCENRFDDIDGMVVIFGTPGLFDVSPVYDLLDKKMKECKKPVYPVLPSIVVAKDEILSFLQKGRVNFPDEVKLGRCLAKVFDAESGIEDTVKLPEVDFKTIRSVIETSENGYIEPEKIHKLLDAAGIKRVEGYVVDSKEESETAVSKLGYPVVMKVIGPLHKTDVSGVVLNVNDQETLNHEYERLMKIDGATGVLLQQMLSGMELFAGAKLESDFGHLVLCGFGGVFIEVLKDVSKGLSPFDKETALEMIKSLKGYAMIKGVRGMKGANEDEFADAISRVCALLEAAPEITEMDLNPLLGTPETVIAVDARICIQRPQ